MPRREREEGGKESYIMPSLLLSWPEIPFILPSLHLPPPTLQTLICATNSRWNATYSMKTPLIFPGSWQFPSVFQQNFSSFILSVLIGYFHGARHCSRCLKYSKEENNWNFFTWATYLIEERGNKQTYVKMRKVKVNVTQSCPTLCNPMDYTVHGIL